MSNKSKRQIRQALGLSPEQTPDIMNLKTMRSASTVGFGWACYVLELIPDSSRVQGKNLGLVGTQEEAQAWVDGNDIRLLRIERHFKKEVTP